MSRIKKNFPLVFYFIVFFDEYGQQPGFIFFGFVLVNSLDPAEVGAQLGPLLQEAVRYSHKLAAR